MVADGESTRLGVTERPDALAAGDRVRDLLWTRPCDLAAAPSPWGTTSG